MARLNELHPQPSESIEALKRRYQRQNRDLAKSNANQSVLIQTLQQELMEMGTENLRLNAEVIRLQSQVDKMKGHSHMDELAKTKETMQEKLAELACIINGLGRSRPRRSIPANRTPRAVKPDENMRVRPEGLLPDIKECRSSQGFERSPSPAAEEFDVVFIKAEQSPAKIVNHMLDIRPRRRKGPSSPEESFSTPAPMTTDFNKSIGNMESLDKKSPLTLHSSLDDEVNNADVVLPQDEDAEEINMPQSCQSSGTGRDEMEDVEAAAYKASPPSLSSPDGIAPSSGASFNQNSGLVSKLVAEHQIRLNSPRGVLEPKSVNSDTSTTPRKLIYAKSHDISRKENGEHPGNPVKREIFVEEVNDKDGKALRAEKEVLKQQRQAPRTKNLRLSGSQRDSISSEDNMEVESSASTERARRTRGTAVNYALPPLNKKMRRDTEALVDAVEGSAKAKRQPSDKTRDTKERLSSDLQIKSEQNNNDANDNRLGELTGPPDVLTRPFRITSRSEEDGSRSSLAGESAAVTAEVTSVDDKQGLQRLREASSQALAAAGRKRRKSSLYEAIPDGLTSGEEAGLPAFGDEAVSKSDRIRMDLAKKDIRGFTMAPSPEPSRATIKSSSQSSLRGSSSSEEKLTAGSRATKHVTFNDTSSTNKRKSSIRVMPDDTTNSSTGVVVPASELLEVRRQRRATLAVTSAAEGVNCNVGMTSSTLKKDGIKSARLSIPSTLDPTGAKANRRKTMVI